MEPTQDSRVRQTEWFVNPANPLMEYKLFTARTDNLIYFITAERGITRSAIPVAQAKDKPIAITVNEHEDIPDNSADQYQKLIKFLSSPVRS